MNDLQVQSQRQSRGSALRIELAKMLGLVAPVTMTADQCEIWLASAEDALREIYPDEVRHVSAEIRRSVTRHNQIVPEIAKLVAERRRADNERSKRQSEDEAERRLPRPKPYIADRDRRFFVAADWAELNEHLERVGATARYHPDGTRYFPGASPGSKPNGRDPQGLDPQDESRT